MVKWKKLKWLTAAAALTGLQVFVSWLLREPLSFAQVTFNFIVILVGTGIFHAVMRSGEERG